MKLYDKKRKSRVDLYDIVNDLDNVHTLTMFPFPEEYQLTCPVKGRPETVTYLAMTSWGDLCHINVQFQSNDNDSSFMNARIEFRLHLNDSGTFYACNEDVLNLQELSDYSGNVKNYRIGSFLLEIRRPFSSTRFTFRGFLTDEKTGKKKFATINLFFMCIGKVFDNLAEFDYEFIKQQFQDKPIELDDSLEQWIQMKGQIKFEDDNESRDLFFWGLYIKSFETGPLTLNHFVGYNHKGMAFHIVQYEREDSRTIIYGHLNMGFGLYHPLTELPAIQLNSVKNILNCKFDISLPKIKRIYSLQTECDAETAIKFHDDLLSFPIKLQEYNGYGFWYRQNLKSFSSENTISVPLVRNVLKIERKSFVDLNDESARSEELTGGKGSSLAVLSNFSKLSSNKFCVPEAIVVTSEAYERFLSHSPNLCKDVQDFSKRILNCKGNQNQIKTECETMQDTFKNIPFPGDMLEEFKNKMISVFGDDFEKNEYRFAIRSSAVGEDSEEMSAAGQMTTFLGVTGLESICRSIVSCWASQFGQTAVEYKRGYGQKINSAMGVVVQRMVASDVAGVMFTCSPLDGNERFLTISASYGLGESVVSGHVEPDTITVKIDVDTSQRQVLGIENITIGAKKHAIHMGEDETNDSEETTKTTVLSKEQQESQCLNDEQILELARIGLEVHEHYGNARDIEFALTNGIWYLLQSRPVTNLESLSEWEIMHEMDTGFLSENECLSKANIGEVMPGASSYNLVEFVIRSWYSPSCASHFKMTGIPLSNFIPYYNISFSFQINNAFFSMKTPMGTMGRKKPDEKSPFIHGFEYAFLGHKNDNQQLFEDIFEKIPEQNAGALTMVRLFGIFITRMLSASKTNQQSCNKYSNYKIDFDFEKCNSSEIHSRIFSEVCSKSLREVFMSHMNLTQVSMFNTALLYHFLTKKSQIDDEQKILDLLSRITSSVDDVFSAQVPKRLMEISNDILEPEKFVQLSDEDAVEYLKQNNTKFNEFLEEFGHRGYKEFDLYALQWRDDCRSLVNLLRTLLNKTEDDNQKKNDDNNNVKQNKMYDLKNYSGLTSFKRKILEKFIIPRTHEGIRVRESGKNLLIKTFDQFRQAFYKLGEKLVEEGKIPDRELVFFLLNDELREIVQCDETKPLRILNAKNRLRLHSKKESFRFDEETFGFDIKPRNLLPKKNIPVGSVKLNGVPISSGRIVARCCVAETLEEAKNIQKGDILITYSTDIGWSPYFAALSGLVTEIGGLVSHGAVIAREYGLPCLVGVQDATAHFTTGEMLLLDTSAGFVARIDLENCDNNNHSDNGQANGLTNGQS